MTYIPPALVTLDPVVAGLAAGVTARRVRQWVAEGLLDNVGTARAIRVRLEDVRRLALPEAVAKRRTRRRSG